MDHFPAIRAELTGSRCCSALGLTVQSYAPVCALARKLIAAGFDAEQLLKVYRGATLCSRVPLAKAARLTVEDHGSTGRLHFVPWRERTVGTAPPAARIKLDYAEDYERVPDRASAAVQS